MEKTPKSLRLQLGIFGRMNVGKSSLLNLMVGQPVSITSIIPGTTTDVVEKAMELLPVGPVLFLDTAGLDDRTELGVPRLLKTQQALERSDVAILVTDAEQWTHYEDEFIVKVRSRQIPCIAVINKIDLQPPVAGLLSKLNELKVPYIAARALQREDRERFLREFKSALVTVCP